MQEEMFCGALEPLWLDFLQQEHDKIVPSDQIT